MAPVGAATKLSVDAQGPGTTAPKNRGFSWVVGRSGGAVTGVGSLVSCEAEDAMAKVRMIHVWRVRTMFDELRMMFVVAVMSVIGTRKEGNGCRRTGELIACKIDLLV